MDVFLFYKLNRGVHFIMDQGPKANAFQFLDKLQFNRFHIQLLIFTTLSSVVMGIISQTVAYILPLVLKEWHLTPVQGGSIASYTFLGLMLGAAGFCILSDRIGRKKTLILAVAISGIFNGIAYFAPDYTVFCVLRFLSGLGLGGIPPLSVTLLSELVPTRMRAKAVTTATCGFPFGWALSGIVAMFIVPNFGWRVLLAVSGFLALILVPFLIVYLAESIRFLSGKGRNEEATEQMRRIEKTARLSASEWSFDGIASGPHKEKGALRQLFSAKLATMTILVWLSYCFTLVTVHGLSVWIPQLFVKAGYSLVKSYSFSIVQSMWALAGGFFSVSSLTGLAVNRGFSSPSCLRLVYPDIQHCELSCISLSCGCCYRFVCVASSGRPACGGRRDLPDPYPCNRCWLGCSGVKGWLDSWADFWRGHSNGRSWFSYILLYIRNAMFHVYDSCRIL